MKLKLFVLAIFGLCLVGCDSGRVSEERTVAGQQELYLKTQPVPVFDYSLQRDLLIQFYKASNESISTYTVISDFGRVLWEGPTMGYGIPANTQLTNPEEINGYYGVTLPQPEPNGLYSSPSTSGTIVMAVMKDGSLAPIYAEHNVVTFPFNVEKDGTAYKQYGSASLRLTPDKPKSR